MSQYIKIFLLISLSLFSIKSIASDAATEEKPKLRTFLVIGEPNAKGWENAVNNPSDRQAVMADVFKNLGGELIGYYFGLANGKNYVIVAMPDDEFLIQAMYLVRLPNDWLHTYTMIELMDSATMAEALALTKKMRAGNTGD
ncbi:hypothetical protein RGQ13_08550 [Thalassotalea psychrophila]|uniref:GYD domain-containing protein n=1 Tax=Thalassotalea psychrophila TaxID=3065647 RepID=A0ABY9TZJ0_9GAMM|nr:hypothetical protein RGQ13_08550 [Colwelliaceae bacterium SQ149]